MFVQAYLATAKEILTFYKGEEPFASFLKKFFAQHKKFGSRDRKHIAHLCYCFFRLGKSLVVIDVEERIIIGLFLCSTEQNIFLEKIRWELNKEADRALDEKLAILNQTHPFNVTDIYSLKTQVSEAIAFEDFSKAMLTQPDIHLRIRPGKEEVVIKKLENASIPFHKINEVCLTVAPATKLDAVLNINKEVVVQDLSSQQVLQSLIEVKKKGEVFTAWDCCAASGGKSILLKDHFPKVLLTVSDIRESILVNLRKRFEQAGINIQKAFVADIAAGHFVLEQNFDLIICDVPCSGSGTWGRTPEQLFFFEEKKIDHYARLQKQIVQNAAKSLKKGSLLLYITCSVFTEENEEAVNFIERELQLKLHSMQYIKGYHQKADTLFAALFSL